MALFFKTPEKKEKEPLRPLYMFYKKLKNLIVNGMKNARNGNQNASRR